MCGPSVSVGGKPGSSMGARARTRAKLNVRPRPLAVKVTGAIQQNNTPVDPKPRTHTKPATTPISKCSQLSHSHAIELATLQRSLLNAVSHFLFPTSLFLSVLLHVFALSSSPCLNILLNAFPLSSCSTPPLSSSLTFISSAFLHSKKTISILDSSCLFFFFILSWLYLQWLSPRVFHAFSSSRLFFSLPQFPLSPSFFSLVFSERRTRARGGYSALRPSPCCPRHGVRLPREPQRHCGRRVRHAHCLRVHASCRLGGFAKEAWKRRQ